MTTNTNTEINNATHSVSHAYCKKCEKITARYARKNPKRLGDCKPCAKAHKQRPEVKKARNTTERANSASTRIRDGKIAIYLAKMTSSITKELFWKVGSSINVKRRLISLRESGYTVELIKCITLPDELDGRKVEQQLHEVVSDTYAPQVSFKGFTECYSIRPNIDLYLFKDHAVMPLSGIDCTY